MMVVSSDPENTTFKCLVCSQTNDVSRHFSAESCHACASFFRRTVSLKIRYICENEQKCSIHFSFRLNCRSCRYDKCIESGMKREAVQQRRNMSKIPKYIQQFRHHTNCETVLREYSVKPLSKSELGSETDKSSSRSTVSPTSMTETSEFDEGPSRYSAILGISCDDLLQFYFDFTKLSLDERKDVNYELGEMAFQFCNTCPGADLLNPEELNILYSYSFFACEIMDSAWLEFKTPHLNVNNNNNDEVPKHLAHPVLKQLQNDVYNLFKNLNMNPIEYSGLKALCIWKLGLFDFTIAMKTIAQEQYMLMFAALQGYYERTLKKEENYAITRIADLTLVLGKVFEVYHTMIVDFKKENIQLLSNIPSS